MNASAYSLFARAHHTFSSAPVMSAQSLYKYQDVQVARGSLPLYHRYHWLVCNLEKHRRYQEICCLQASIGALLDHHLLLSLLSHTILLPSSTLAVDQRLIQKVCMESQNDVKGESSRSLHHEYFKTPFSSFIFRKLRRDNSIDVSLFANRCSVLVLYCSPKQSILDFVATGPSHDAFQRCSSQPSIASPSLSAPCSSEQYQKPAKQTCSSEIYNHIFSTRFISHYFPQALICTSG